MSGVIGVSLGTMVLGCSLIAGCDSGAVPGNSATPVSTVELLRQGAPQACSAQDVRETVIRTIRPEFQPDNFVTNEDIQSGSAQFTFELGLITLANVDRNVGSVACDANFVIHRSGLEDRTYSISYVVRPSVENPEEFVVQSNVGPARGDLERSVYMAILDSRAARVSAETQSASSESDDANMSYDSEDDLPGSETNRQGTIEVPQVSEPNVDVNGM